MLISVVLRLSPVALASGELAGEAEDVRTGERGQFRDAAELTRWCARLVVPAPRTDDPVLVAVDTPSVRKSSS